MNVALINGPAPGSSLFVREGRCTQESSIWSTQWPPLTLALLGAIAKRAGHQTLIYDCPATGLSAADLATALSQSQPDLCLLSVSTPSFTVDMATAALLKKAFPQTRLAVLGVHSSVLDLELLAGYPQVDFVIRNEPEETFDELLIAIEQNTPVAEVLGLSYRADAGPRRNADRPFIEDLDSLPYPGWELIDLAPYRLPFSQKSFLSLAPLRGCPFRCSFCTAGTYYGHRLRLRSVDSVIAEIRLDRERFSVDDFFMWAETFTLDRDFVMDLCEALIRQAPGIRWTCNSRTDTVDARMLTRMKQAGCWMISFGIESGDPAVLTKTAKKLKDPDIKTPIRQARQAGMTTLGHFILGLPGDTKKTMRRTVDDALKLDLDFAQFYAAAPFVGTDLYRRAVRDGQLDAEAFSSISQSVASLELPGLPPETVNQELRRAVRRFYLRPRRILGLLRLAGWGLFRQVVRDLPRRIKRIFSH